jgi:hypothetical protein
MTKILRIIFKIKLEFTIILKFKKNSNNILLLNL